MTSQSSGVQLLPMVYHPRYNIRLTMVEKMHPFDTHKWARIMKKLTDPHLNLGITENRIHHSREATEEELLLAHTKKYLQSLKVSWNIAQIMDMCILTFVPNSWLQKTLLTPLRYQAYGTLLAGQLALERGWAINIGGGFHHSSKENGREHCLFADITMLVNYALSLKGRVKKVMIVDLDAHQGIGYESDLQSYENVFIMDVYNKYIRPKDDSVKKAIKCNVALRNRVKDYDYLFQVETNFLSSVNKFLPDLLVYNAGVDVLQGDHTGRLSITPSGIIKRDQLLFVVCRQRKIPIVMLTGGGFLRRSAQVVADSIKNLFTLGIIGDD